MTQHVEIIAPRTSVVRRLLPPAPPVERNSAIRTLTFCTLNSVYEMRVGASHITLRCVEGTMCTPDDLERPAVVVDSNRGATVLYAYDLATSGTLTEGLRKANEYTQERLVGAILQVRVIRTLRDQSPAPYTLSRITSATWS